MEKFSNTNNAEKTTEVNAKIETTETPVGDDLIQIETKYQENQPEIPDAEISNEEKYETLEEINKAFSVAKTEFLELTKWNLYEDDENIAKGKRAIEGFDANAEVDKNLAKKHKEKYLKAILFSIENIKNQEETHLKEIEKDNQERNPLRSGFKVNVKNSAGEMVVGEVSGWTHKDVMISLSDGEIVSVPIGEYYNLSFDIIEEKVSEPENIVSDSENKYETARTELLEIKKEYQAKKSEYDQALDEFYRNEAQASILKKTAKFFGFQPDLPEELVDLENEYKNLKNAYASSLNFTLAERSKKSYNRPEPENSDSVLKNNTYEENSDSTKIAFAKKFILKPNEQLLKKQEEIALSEAQRSQVRRILGTLGKNKWFVRFGAVTLAGLAGAATGGLAAFVAGAGVQASRIFAGTVAGGLAGSAVRGFTQRSVDESIKNVEDTKKNILKNFSIDDLDKLEDELLDVQKIKDEKVKAQKVASIAAAVLAGGAVSGGLNSLNGGGELVTDLSKEITSSVENVKSIWQDNPELAELIGGEAVPAPKINNSVGEVVPDVNEKMKVPDYTAEGKVADSAVTEKLSKVVTSEVTADSKITPETINNKLFNESVVDTTSNESEVVLEHIYTVQKGDNIWDITENVFAEELYSLTSSEKNQVIGYLMEKVENNPELLKSLNIKSNDLDLIYPKEEIDLTLLGQELKNLVELQKTGDLPAYPKQSMLEVQSDDLNVNKVPIKFTDVSDVRGLNNDPFAVESEKVLTTPPPLGYPNFGLKDNPLDVSSQSDSAPNVVERFSEPPTSANGNYFETTDYKNRVIEVFGTEKNFKLSFNNRISDIENPTYDMFTRGIYDSPYNFLKSMTLEQIEKFDSRDSLAIRGDLGSNIKYETYLAWIQKISDIRESGIPYHPETRLSDLFSRYVVEEMVERVNLAKK